MTRRIPYTEWLASAAMAATLAGCGPGCSAQSPEQSTVVQGDDGGSPDSGLDSARDDGAKTDAADDSAQEASTNPPLPDGIPAGWELYTDFSPACKFYVPGEKGEMPAPLEWETCPAQFPGSLECEKLKFTGYIAGQQYSFCDIDPQTGHPLLAVQRFGLQGGRTDRSDTIVAEADGPVRFALMQASPSQSGCDVMLQYANQGRVSVHLYGDDPSKPNPFISGVEDFTGFPEGIIGDKIDNRHPKLAYRGTFDKTNVAGHLSWVSSDWFIKEPGNGNIIVEDWDKTTTQNAYRPNYDPPGYRALSVLPRGKDLFIYLWANANTYMLSWNPDAGLRPLLYWDDDTRGAGILGTDGKDMVWTYGEGKPPGTPNPYTKFTIMAAPYTTDPQQVQATQRPLRQELKSDANIWLDEQGWRVGCGYAARTTWRRAIAVVRIGDGAMWFIPRVVDPNWSWAKVLGVSSEHIYVIASSVISAPVYPEGMVVARFKLSSLGEPLSPDVVDVDESGNPIP